MEKRTDPSTQPLMTCRHCLRYSLGACKRDPNARNLPEPLFLRLGDGTRLRLQFDCEDCLMLVERP